MAFRTAVFHTFRHTIWLMPNDVLPQIPPICPECKSQHPRNADQILLLVTPRHFLRGVPARITGVGRWVVSGACGIAIPNVEPQCAIRAQYSAYFSKNFHQFPDVLIRCLFQTNLSRHAIITESIIRWRGYATMDTAIRDTPHQLKAIALFDGVFYFIHLRLRTAADRSNQICCNSLLPSNIRSVRLHPHRW